MRHQSLKGMLEQRLLGKIYRIHKTDDGMPNKLLSVQSGDGWPEWNAFFQSIKHILVL